MGWSKEERGHFNWDMEWDGAKKREVILIGIWNGMEQKSGSFYKKK